MRITKDPLERRNEILDTAQMLFTTKGFAKTTINDMLQTIGIARGTFYYYFKSKEEVMDAIIQRLTDSFTDRAKAIVAMPELSANEKLFLIFTGNKADEDKEQMIDQFHQVENAQMHQKSLVETITQLTPILTEVLEQGIREGIYNTPYPQEVIEFILVSSQFLFDEGIFRWEPQELKKKAEAFVWTIETILGAEKGSLLFITKLMGK